MKAGKDLMFPSLGISEPFRRWLLILLALVLALGVFFRFANLDKKPVWGDEAHTFSVISGYSSFSVISGYSESEVIDELAPKGIVSIGDFLRYQYPNSDRNIGDTLNKLYTDVHPPLYFLLARSWVQLFGHSVSVLRSISAILSILAIPCVYWLCLELFDSHLASSIAAVLLLVSPIQIIYGQEARPYSLLILVVLFSGASLLWAIRTQKKTAWFTYSLASALGLYSQYFFVLVLLGYLAYMVLIESFRFTKRLRNFLLATFASFIAFAPWAILVLQHLSYFKGASAWMQQHTLTLPGAIRLWAENISFSFIDPRTSEYFGFGKFGFYFLIPLVLVLVIYSVYILFTKTSQQKYLFALLLIISTALPLIVIDVVAGGNRQTWPRYLIPCFLGIQICVTYLLSYKISSLDFTKKGWQRSFWCITTAILVSAGILFCSIISQADTWWNKYGGEATNQVSQIVHQAKDPLIISNRQHPGTVFFYNLNPNVKLLFVQNQTLKASDLPKEHDIFLLNPTETMKVAFKPQKYALQKIAEFPDPSPVPTSPTELWKVKSLNLSQ